MAASTPSKDNKVFDVAKPGNTPPSETSRPTIVGHKPMTMDPMVNNTNTGDPLADSLTQPPKAAATDKPAAKIAVTTAGEKVIAPLKAGKADEEVTAEVAGKAARAEAEGKSAATVSGVTATETAAAKTDDTGKAETSKADAGKYDAAEGAADGKEDGKDDDKKKAEEPKVDVAHVEELIASKQYFVSIGQNKHAVSKGSSVLTGILLGVLILVGVAAAWDAGYLDVGIEPPFDFITNVNQ